MALAPRTQARTPAAGVSSTAVSTARVGDVELGHATRDNITVTTFGQSVKVRNNIYARTNFYIKQSRPYIARRKLRTYWHIRFMQWVFLVYCILIAPMPFVPDYIGWPWALVSGVIGMVWFVIFVQHAHVICWTIRKVLSQPILPDSKQQKGNEFYEIKVERLEGIFLQAKDSGVGVLAAASGSIKIQALNETAAKKIKLTVVCSVVCLITTLIALVVSVGIFTFRITTQYKHLLPTLVTGRAMNNTLESRQTYWPS